MPSEDGNRPTITDILKNDHLETYTRGGQIGNARIDRKILVEISRHDLIQATELSNQLVEAYPEYEFSVTDDFKNIVPGVLISWRRKPDDQDDKPAEQGGSAT